MGFLRRRAGAERVRRRDRAGTGLLPSPRLVGVEDPALHERLAREGYVRLGVMLSADEIASCREIFDEAMRRIGRPLGDHWFPTILMPDDDTRDFIAHSLEPLIAPKVAGVLDPELLELLRLHFSVKPPSPLSELGPHQDFSVVDERVATSLYLWVPLEDMDRSNGTLHVVPGSHRFANRIRSQHVPATFDDVMEPLKDAALRLDCVAGEVVLMVSGVIHFSPANTSDQVRLAAHGILKPIAAPMVFYYADDQTPAGMVESYEFGMDDYLQQVHQGRPEHAQQAALVERPPSSMTPERFAAGLRATRDARP